MQRDIDLLLTILPFEKAWFAKVAPKFNVQWVGHPVLDRIRKVEVAEATVNRCATTLEEARQASRRAKADAVKAGVELEVLARRQLAVEQRLVPEQSHAPAHLPGL